MGRGEASEGRCEAWHAAVRIGWPRAAYGGLYLACHLRWTVRRPADDYMDSIGSMRAWRGRWTRLTDENEICSDSDAGLECVRWVGNEHGGRSSGRAHGCTGLAAFRLPPFGSLKPALGFSVSPESRSSDTGWQSVAFLPRSNTLQFGNFSCSPCAPPRRPRPGPARALRA